MTETLCITPCETLCITPCECECGNENVPRCCIAGEVTPTGDLSECHGDGNHPEVDCWCPCHGGDCPVGGEGPCRCDRGEEPDPPELEEAPRIWNLGEAARAASHHILDAEQRTAQMQERQLVWAETSPEAEAALRTARTRAVFRTAAGLNASPVDLDHFRFVMEESWSVSGERSGVFFETADEHLEELTGEREVRMRLGCLLYVLQELWPDVVAETDTWARRHCGVQTPAET